MADVGLDTLPSHPVLAAKPVMSYLERVTTSVADDNADLAAEGLIRAQATITALRTVGVRIDADQQKTLHDRLDTLEVAIAKALGTLAEEGPAPPAEPARPTTLQELASDEGIPLDALVGDKSAFIDLNEELTAKQLAIGLAAVIGRYVSKRENIIRAYLDGRPRISETQILAYQSEIFGILNLIIRIVYGVGGLRRGEMAVLYFTKGRFTSGLREDQKEKGSSNYYTGRTFIPIREVIAKTAKPELVATYDVEKALKTAGDEPSFLDNPGIWHIWLNGPVLFSMDETKASGELLETPETLAPAYKALLKTDEGTKYAELLADLGIARLMATIHLLGIDDLSSMTKASPIDKIFRYTQHLLVEYGVWYWAETIVDEERRKKYGKEPDDENDLAINLKGETPTVRGEFVVDDVLDVANVDDDDLDAELDDRLAASVADRESTAKDAIELGAKDQWMTDW